MRSKLNSIRSNVQHQKKTNNLNVYSIKIKREKEREKELLYNFNLLI